MSNSPPVVRARFWVDQDTEQFRCVLFEADFEFGLDIMHARKGKIVGQGAMTGDVKTAANPLDDEIMNVEDLTRGDCPNSIEDVFGALGSGKRLHGDIGVRKDTLDCGGHRPDELSRA